MNRRLAVAAVASVASLGLVGSASATATFDPATGSGFVGKGDVQVPFGWNNDQLQKNATGVDFRYSDSTEYEFTCQQRTEEDFVAGRSGRTQRRTVVVKNVSDTATVVTYDTTTATRTNKKGSVTGFKLNGFEGTPTTVGTVPAEGGSCTMDDGTTGTINDEPVTVTDMTGDTLTGVHAGQGKSAVVWTDGVSTIQDTTTV